MSWHKVQGVNPGEDIPVTDKTLSATAIAGGDVILEIAEHVHSPHCVDQRSSVRVTRADLVDLFGVVLEGGESHGR